MTPKAESGRLYERVARDLSSRIARGEYKIGQRLPSERELAQSYAVSRPTVREALIALELDGLVEVRTGSGVYVTATSPRGGKAGAMDIGPFELLEARRAIESEACALAATRISDEEVEQLELLLAEMNSAEDDAVAAEDADRRFHLLIANTTRNSAMLASVQMLWDARARSPQTQLLSVKAHAAASRRASTNTRQSCRRSKNAIRVRLATRCAITCHACSTRCWQQPKCRNSNKPANGWRKHGRATPRPAE